MDHDDKEANVPSFQWLVEGMSVMKHVFHVCDLRRVPGTDIVIELVLILKQTTHIGNCRGIPCRNMTVLGKGGGSIGAPALDSLAK